MNAVGAPGVGLAIALETIFPPIPSEVVLPLAGFTAAQGGYSIAEAIIWATVGSIVGALVLYWLGAAWGEARLTRMFDKMPLVEGEDVTKTVAWFNKYGRRAVFFGRLVPGIRSLISIPAGIRRMPLMQFSVFTLLGSGLWNSLLVTAGYLLGQRWHLVEKYMNVFSKIVYVLLILLIVWFVVSRLRKQRRRAREEDHAKTAAEASENAPAVAPLDETDQA